MTPRMRVFRQFILNAPLPPHHGSDHGGNQRYEHQNNPAQPAQCLFVETEGERLRDLWRDTDKLFATKQPVHAARDEIEPLLILRDRIALNELSVVNCNQPHEFNLNPLSSPPPFSSCWATCCWPFTCF